MLSNTLLERLQRLDRTATAVALSVLATGFTLAASELAARLLWQTSATFAPAVLIAQFCGHCLAALAVGALIWGCAQVARRLPWHYARSLAALTFLMVLPLAAHLGGALSAGEWVARQPFAPALRWGITLGVPCCAAAAVWVLADRVSAITWRALLLVLGSAATLVNSTVLPGLYQEAHLALYAASVVSLTLALGRRTHSRPGKETSPAPRWGRGGSILLGAGFVSLAILIVGQARGELARQSAGLGAALATFVPVTGTQLQRVLSRLDTLPKRFAERPTRLTPLAQRPKSVLLIVVDTLRCDALPPVRTGRERFMAHTQTPNLDAWLAGAFRFGSAYSQASFTRGSMPSMFRSIETFEHPEKTGVPLGALAKELGLRPIAVVPQYFLLPIRPGGHSLLDGFDPVEFYEKEHQETIIAQARTVFTSLGDTPFFAWVHFYNMHLPYFAGDSTPSSGDKHARYGAALGWLDTRFGELMQLLDELGLSESTLIVLAADHGEHLGDGGRTGHGAGVSDEELHVPLAIKLPGYPGGEMDTLVGNIDILPTVVDALGQQTRADQRGVSLLPLLTTGVAPVDRALYARSTDDDPAALFTQDHKLVFSREQDSFALYERQTDRADARNLLTRSPEIAEPLISDFVRRHPGLFIQELKREETRAALGAALQRVPLSPPSPGLDFVVRAVAATKDKNLAERAAKLFDKTRDLQTRLLLSRLLSERGQSAWSARWERILAGQVGKPVELSTVEALGRDRFVSVRSKLASQRIRALAAGENDVLLAAWLRLILPWPKPAKTYAPVFLELFSSRGTAAPDPDVVLLTLDNVASLPRSDEPAAAHLEGPILPYLESDSVPLARAACEALGKVGSIEAYAALSVTLLAHADARVRQAALRSVYQIAPSEAFDALVEAAADPLLVGDAIQLLGQLRDPRALPLLGKLASKHPNKWTRNQAKRAKDAISKRK